MSVVSITVFGITAVAHALLIAGVIVKIASFTAAQYRPNSFVQLARRLCANHLQAKNPGKILVAEEGLEPPTRGL